MLAQAGPAAGHARRPGIERGPGDAGDAHPVLQNAPRGERGGRWSALLLARLREVSRLLLVVFMLIVLVLDLNTQIAPPRAACEPSTATTGLNDEAIAQLGCCDPKAESLDLLNAGIVMRGTLDSSETAATLRSAGDGPLHATRGAAGDAYDSSETAATLRSAGDGSLHVAASAAGDAYDASETAATLRSAGDGSLHATRGAAGDACDSSETAATLRSAGDGSLHTTTDAIGDAYDASETAARLGSVEDGLLRVALNTRDARHASHGNDDHADASAAEALENAAAGSDDVGTTTPELRAAGMMTTTDLDLIAHPPALFDDYWLPWTILLASVICAGRARCGHAAAGDVRLEDRLRMRWRPVLRGAEAGDDVGVGRGLLALQFL